MRGGRFQRLPVASTPHPSLRGTFSHKGRRDSTYSLAATFNNKNPRSYSAMIYYKDKAPAARIEMKP